MAEAEDTNREELVPWRMMRHKNVVLYEFSTELDELRDFAVRDDDVWVCSFPRSGTTLTLELVYLIQTLDFETATNVIQLDRTPWIDIVHPKVPGYRGTKYVDGLESPRVIKSHLHHFMLPDQLKNGKGKIVYVSRNPGASALSFYKLVKYFKYCPTDTLREWLELFLQDGVFCSPWWLHVLQYWERRNDEHILMIRFEELITNKKHHIKKIADFLCKSLTDEQIDRIDKYTDIDAMKTTGSINFKTDKEYGGLINQGSLDAWRQEVPGDIQERMAQMVQDRLGHTDWKL